MKQYAIITGASQGLGKSFATELARRGNNLILISLPGQNLKNMCSELEVEFGIDIVAIEKDLSSVEALLEVSSSINAGYHVNMLINNAGVGGTNMFTHVDSDYLLKIINVNITATSILTHQLLPNLLKQPKSYILNISSLAAFSPVGYKTIYPASKAFIHSFSRGLYQELKDTSVFVSVVNPGPMATNADVTSRIKNHGILGRLTQLNPDKVAQVCIAGIFKRDTVIMVNPLSWLAMKILPIWIRMPLMSNAIKKEICNAEGFYNRYNRLAGSQSAH